MAVALRGAAAVPAGNPTTSFTVTIDAAVVAGDVLFLAVTSRDSTGAGTLSVTDNDTGGNTWTKIGNSTDHKATLWWKRATSGTASKTVTVNNAVGSASGVLKAFSGAYSDGDPFTNVTVETNASADETAAGITPTFADSMLCAAIFNYANDNAVTSLSSANFGAFTTTEKLSTGGSDCATAFGHDLVTSGASGNVTWAQTDGTTYSIVWAIRVQAYTLTAAAGTFSYSGADAALSKGYKVTADAGAFTYSGPDANLLWKRNLPADFVSFSYSGGAASLLRGYSVVAEAGLFPYQGGDVQFAKGFGLALSSGVFSYLGGDAGLLFNQLLAAANGSYSYQGNDAGLLRGYGIVAENGNFSYLGADVSFLRSLLIAAANGSFSYSGGDAGLFRGFAIAADRGAYSYQGNNASLLFNRLGVLAVGSFSYSGGDANLTKASAIVLVAECGVCGYSGAAAELLIAHILPADPAAFSYQGQDANLTWTRVYILIAANGSFAYTGADAFFSALVAFLFPNAPLSFQINEAGNFVNLNSGESGTSIAGDNGLIIASGDSSFSING